MAINPLKEDAVQDAPMDAKMMNTISMMVRAYMKKNAAQFKGDTGDKGDLGPSVDEDRVNEMVAECMRRYRVNHFGGSPRGRVPAQDVDFDPSGTVQDLTAPNGSSLVGFLQSGTVAIATDVQGELRRVGHTPEQFGAAGDNVTNDAAEIQAALDVAASNGADVEVVLSRASYILGTTGLTIPDGVVLRGRGRGNTHLTYTGSGAAITVEGKTGWALKDFRLNLGSSATLIALNILTSSGNNVRWGKVSGLEIATASTVSGQKGIQVVATAPEIVVDNWFEDINIFGLDQPIIRTDTEGNTWRGIHIDTWGAGASRNAINSQSHAEFMQARIAGIPAGGSGVAYKQSGSGNIDHIVVDLGASDTALNFTGTRNVITLGRTEGTTPLGTCNATNLLFDAYAGNVVQVLAKSGAAVAAPADTSENALATITVPANVMGTNGVLRIRFFFTYTNNANSKTLRLRYSSISGGTPIAVARTTQLASFFEVQIANRNATNSQVHTGITGTHGDGTITTYSGVSTTAVDTTAATTLVITAEKATGTDTVTLESYSVELMPG